MNHDFDQRYNELKIIFSKMNVNERFALVYDIAKRLIDDNGLGPVFVKNLYILGYIDGIRSERQRRNKICI